MNKKLISVCETVKGYIDGDKWWMICINDVWYIGDPRGDIKFWKATGDYSDDYIQTTDDTYQVFDLATIVMHDE